MSISQSQLVGPVDKLCLLEDFENDKGNDNELCTN